MTRRGDYILDQAQVNKRLTTMLKSRIILTTGPARCMLAMDVQQFRSDLHPPVVVLHSKPSTGEIMSNFVSISAVLGGTPSGRGKTKESVNSIRFPSGKTEIIYFPGRLRGGASLPPKCPPSQNQEPT